ARRVRVPGDHRQAEDAGIEALGALEVAHLDRQVVEAVDVHGAASTTPPAGPPPPGCPLPPARTVANRPAWLPRRTGGSQRRRPRSAPPGSPAREAGASTAARCSSPADLAGSACSSPAGSPAAAPTSPSAPATWTSSGAPAA